MTAKERLYAAIRGEQRDRVPVVPIFMAWAARYVGHTYRDYYLDGDVLVQAQLAVMRAFQTDQVSAISDPWRESSAYGMEFDYPEEGVGVPRERLLKRPDDVARLGPIDVHAAPRTKQRIDSVAKMAAEVGQTHSVLGWVEGPMAQYCDLRGMHEAMIDLIDNPGTFRQAAEVLVDNAVAFARAQIEAGADMIGVGDAAASLIGPKLYVEHVLAPQRRLFEGIHAGGAAVRLHICGNIGDIIAQMATTGADVIDVDWMVPLPHARRAVGPEVALCGNFDPAGVLLQGPPESVAAAARQCIAEGGDRFCLMPGCEVPPGTPEANIRAFCCAEGCLISDALAR
jgi:MtaA/CmuA family methyltransferase